MSRNRLEKSVVAMTPQNMRAVMFLEPGKLELREVPVPEPSPKEILIKIRAATTCGTDVKTYLRGHPKIIPPTLFGHEFSGDVVAVGSEVTEFQPGMRVVPHNTAPCGICFSCKNGQQNLCDDLKYNFGAFAEYAVVPSRIVQLNTFEIPDHISYAQASIMEPLACVVHGQNSVRIQPGETVAIVGAGGPIGLMHLQLALKRGASQVIAVDLVENRLAIAEKLGATSIVNPKQVDPVEVIRDLTEGRGVDVAIESAGAKNAWMTAINSVRKGGRVLWFGGLKAGTSIELDTTWIHYGELSLFGVFHTTPADVYSAFQLIMHQVINTDFLLSGEMPLEKTEDALTMMAKGECVKMVINPDLQAD